jgi:DHA2 family methylenomycin A resistance protein-like MFS transporter
VPLVPAHIEVSTKEARYAELFAKASDFVGAQPTGSTPMAVTSPVTVPANEARFSRFAKPLTLAAMSLGYGVVQLDVTIVNTALNTIGSSLGGGVSELQWVVSTYTIAFAAHIQTTAE